MWIYRHDTKKFVEIADDDIRISRPPHAPAGCVRFTVRAPSKANPPGRFAYFAYGATAQEAADRENRHNLAEIAKHEHTIAQLRLRLVKP